jgi:probable rRNA maturation factor
MTILRFLDRQKVRAFDRHLFRQIARALLEELLARKSYELGVHFVGAPEMAALNETFLGHEGPTDVITFNHSEGAGIPSLRGEIFICMDEALTNARRFRASWQEESVRYLVHGILHLEGCDDTKPRARRAMKRRENLLLKDLSRRFDLRKLARHKQAISSHERK